MVTESISLIDEDRDRTTGTAHPCPWGLTSMLHADQIRLSPHDDRGGWPWAHFSGPFTTTFSARWEAGDASGRGRRFISAKQCRSARGTEWWPHPPTARRVNPWQRWGTATLVGTNPAARAVKTGPRAQRFSSNRIDPCWDQQMVGFDFWILTVAEVGRQGFGIIP